jgi:hypothetical protein
MRRSKWLGFVATAFCALMLGAGTGVATQSHDSHRPADGASQYGKVDNGTAQHAASSAATKQENKNIPFSFFAVGSNNGKVDQYNQADTTSKAENSNQTSQDLNQDQNAKFEGRDHRDCGCRDSGRNDGNSWNNGKDNSWNNGKDSSKDNSWGNGNESRGGQCGCGEQGRGDKGQGSNGASQQGTVDNWTKQQADSSAKTEQTNVNAPISIFSVGSNNGKVDQYNQADTRSKSENGNDTNQQADQHQHASGKDGCGADGKSASQNGSVSNSTDQSAQSSAKTKQVNVNAPISLFSVGSNNGDVHQGNDANTASSSSNWNSTGQSAGQTQNT